MNIHFLYRFWSVRSPHLISLFSSPKFVALISLYPITEFVVWYLICIYALTGDVDEIATHILRQEYAKRYGKVLNDGWIIMNYWEGGFSPGTFYTMISFDVIIVVSFTSAITLGVLTFSHIRKSEKISKQAQALQRTLFIAVCAQTFVPLVFVYVPHFVVINMAFFKISLQFVDAAWMRMTAFFPAWDAVIIIVLIRDYRDGLLGMFRKKKSVSIKETTWMTASSLAPASHAIASSPVAEVSQFAFQQ
ncbi:hypothetical protein PMAYCL1PPCAC_31751, partial [Pristionchus mayeri]